MSNMFRQDMFLSLSNAGAKGDPHNFAVKFHSPIMLDLNTSHSIGLVNLSMYYSWYKVISYNNKSVTPQMLERTGQK